MTILRLGEDELPDGRRSTRFLLRAGAVEAELDSYGARLTACRVAGTSVLLGLDSAAAYVGRPGGFGATIGRYANRIAGGRFTLDGVAHAIPANNGPNALHGGPTGFDRAVWRVEAVGASAGDGVVLAHDSPDGDQGFPGALAVTLRVSLGADGSLALDYAARTDRATVLNLTNHAYFNLAGEGQGDALDHVLSIAADAFTPVDGTLIPTGEVRPVAGTPFDFRAPAAIGARIGDADDQLRIGQGYDHNFMLRGGPGLKHAARAVSPRSGIALDVLTTEPCVQFYTGNFLGPGLAGRDGAPLCRHAGFCLETQHAPDSPNHPHFPSTVLRPGEAFASRTIYRFARAG